MTDPNQGPLTGQGPGPGPGTNTTSNPGTNTGPNLSVRDIDLSDPTINSDGQAQQPQATDNTEFLAHLSRIFNNNTQYTTTLGYTVNFIGGLPRGYVLETRRRAHVSSSSIVRIVRTDLWVRGHPRRDFRSVFQFAIHVYHIMRNDLVSCDCSSCQ
ncbi:hypothetical protein E4T49_03138 [Aureobasidium sp. EXF-10728]|nr:hypothetical protein E4T49_03138 [Aureobasidium sp. EXF-10728]